MGSELHCYVPSMRSRDHRLDAAKGVLIFMVVLGHIMAAVSPWDDDLLRVFQTVVYAFHMPAFVFLTGITARSGRIAHRVAFLLILLFTALPLYYGWMHLLGLGPDFDFLVPYWITWFLLALVWWTLTVPLIGRFPRTMLGLSVLAGIFGGIIPEYDYELSIARALAFWPFFVLGRVYGARILSWAGDRGGLQRAGLLLAAGVPLTVFYLYDLDKLWFYGSRGFAWLETDLTEGAALRAAVALSAVLCTLALLSLVPKGPGMWAAAGRRSLAVYLLHGFAVRLLNRPLDDILEVVPSAAMVVVCFLLAAVTTWVFSHRAWDAGIRRYGEGVIRCAVLSWAWLSAVLSRSRQPPDAAHDGVRTGPQADHQESADHVGAGPASPEREPAFSGR